MSLPVSSAVDGYSTVDAAAPKGAKITAPYLLVLNVPLYRYAGQYWADPLWKKDLEAHQVGIARLAIACPIVDAVAPAGWMSIASDIMVHPLPPMGRFALLRAPLVAATLWQAVSDASIVHSGVAGWPYPLGWLAVIIARWRRRFLVLVVESAFWRIAPGAKASLWARLRAVLWEHLNARAVRASDLSFFTTRAYLDALHSGSKGAAYVLPAVWIDDGQLIDEAELAGATARRDSRLLFAGRLTRAKGVELLLDAVESSGVPVDLIGEGEMRGAVLDMARRRPELVRLLDPVDYGSAFTALLDGYAGLVVPTLTDEQPRVIFDAFARGVAVIASATAGNQEIVDDGYTGILFAAGNADALALAITTARSDAARLAAMGLAARRALAGRTHAAMHASRAALIAGALQSTARGRLKSGRG